MPQIIPCVEKYLTIYLTFTKQTLYSNQTERSALTLHSEAFPLRIMSEQLSWLPPDKFKEAPFGLQRPEWGFLRLGVAYPNPPHQGGYGVGESL